MRATQQVHKLEERIKRNVEGGGGTERGLKRERECVCVCGRRRRERKRGKKKRLRIKKS